MYTERTKYLQQFGLNTRSGIATEKFIRKQRKKKKDNSKSITRSNFLKKKFDDIVLSDVRKELIFDDFIEIDEYKVRNNIYNSLKHFSELHNVAFEYVYTDSCFNDMISMVEIVDKQINDYNIELSIYKNEIGVCAYKYIREFEYLFGFFPTSCYKYMNKELRKWFEMYLGYFIANTGFKNLANVGHLEYILSDEDFMNDYLNNDESDKITITSIKQYKNKTSLYNKLLSKADKYKTISKEQLLKAFDKTIYDDIYNKYLDELISNLNLLSENTILNYDYNPGFSYGLNHNIFPENDYLFDANDCFGIIWEEDILIEFYSQSFSTDMQECDDVSLYENHIINTEMKEPIKTTDFPERFENFMCNICELHRNLIKELYEQNNTSLKK